MPKPTPFPHQLVAVDFLAARPRAGLYDEQGLGKTASAILAADRVGARRVLVLCPTVVALNWQREFATWSPQRTVSIVTSSAKWPQQPGDVVVVTHGLVAALREQLRAYLNEAQRSAALPCASCCIIDEAHAFRTRTAQRTAALLGAGGVAHAATWVWMLTGTPAPNSPLDLFTTLRALDPARIKGMSFDAYRDRYCRLAPSDYGDGWRVVGAKNTDELQRRLKGWFLRRRTEEVLTLPPRRYGDVLLRNSSDLVEKLEQQLPPEVRDAIDEAQLLEDPSVLHQALGENMAFARLMNVIGTAKAAAIGELLDEELSADPQRCVVVPYWHRAVGDELQTRLGAHSPTRIDGSASAAQRQSAVDAFQSGRARVMLLQIVAGGVGITLTRSADVLFAERSFVPADNAQAAARCFRIGQTRSVLIRTAVLAGSIDETVSRILQRKEEMIAATLAQ